MIGIGVTAVPQKKKTSPWLLSVASAVGGFVLGALLFASSPQNPDTSKRDKRRSVAVLKPKDAGGGGDSD